jgi:plastocyanin
VRWPLLVAAICALAVAGYAVAGGAEIGLGPSGPQPSTVTVGWGDTVSFVNRDSVSHGLTSRSGGIPAATLAPGQTSTVVMTGHEGSYSYDQTGTKNYPGAVLLKVEGTVTLHASALSIAFGRPLVLTGSASLAGAPVGTPVAIQQHVRGQRGWGDIATVTSGPDGSFSDSIQLKLGGDLRATIAAGQILSPVATVELTPALTIGASPSRLKVGRPFVIRGHVTPARGAASAVTLLHYEAKRHAWRAVARKVQSSSGAVAFRQVATYGRSLFRVGVVKHDVGRGFAAAQSRQVIVTGLGTPPPPKGKKKH